MSTLTGRFIIINTTHVLLLFCFVHEHTCDWINDKKITTMRVINIFNKVSNVHADLSKLLPIPFPDILSPFSAVKLNGTKEQLWKAQRKSRCHHDFKKCLSSATKFPFAALLLKTWLSIYNICCCCCWVLLRLVTSCFSYFGKVPQLFQTNGINMSCYTVSRLGKGLSKIPQLLQIFTPMYEPLD